MTQRGREGGRLTHEDCESNASDGMSRAAWSARRGALLAAPAVAALLGVPWCPVPPGVAERSARSDSQFGEDGSAGEHLAEVLDDRIEPDSFVVHPSPLCVHIAAGVVQRGELPEVVEDR